MSSNITFKMPNPGIDAELFVSDLSPHLSQGLWDSLEIEIGENEIALIAVNATYGNVEWIADSLKDNNIPFDMAWEDCMDHGPGVRYGRIVDGTYQAQTNWLDFERDDLVSPEYILSQLDTGNVDKLRERCEKLRDLYGIPGGQAISTLSLDRESLDSWMSFMKEEDDMEMSP